MAKQKDEPSGGLFASTRKIWLAGLGALAEAEKRGDELFQTLAKKGEKYEDVLRAPVEKASGVLMDSMSTARSRAGSTLRELETAFDRQVAAAMKRVGIASREEIDSLRREVARLKKQVEPRAARAGTRRTSKSSKSAGARKSSKKPPL